MKITLKNKGILYYAVISFFITLINSWFATNEIVCLSIGLIETAIIIYFIIKENVSNFIIWLILFTSGVIENGFFVTGDREKILYGFFNLPVIHYYHIFLLILIVFMVNYVRVNQNIDLKVQKISSRLLLTFSLGLVMMLFTYFIDDNHVCEIFGLLRYTLQDVYNTFFAIFLFIIIFEELKRNNQFSNQLKETMIGYLLGVTYTATLQILAGHYVEINDATNLISPLSFFWSPLLIALYLTEKNGNIYLLTGILAIIIQIKYSLGIPGAFWLFLLLIIVFFVFRLFIESKNKKRVKRIVFLVVIFVIMIIIGLYGTMDELFLGNTYVSYKLLTLLNLFSIQNNLETWFILVGDSIGIRIETFVNIAIEFYMKPWFVLLGKGYGGSISHAWGIYDWGNIASFPEVMSASGVFSWFHTQLAEILINFGLVGGCFVVKVLVYLLKNIFNCRGNIWGVAGAFWVMILPLSFHSLIIGAAFMAYGYFSWINKSEG